MANSKRKCGFCKERKPAEEMYIVGIQAFCNRDHWIENQVKNKDKLIKEGKKIQRADLKERKTKLKTASDYIKEAQTSINAYVRMRDLNKSCISCDSSPEQKRGGTMDCGHYRSRGAASHLRFNLFNMAGQCVKCNRYNSGNAVDYRIGLIKRIGIERVEKIESDNEPKKFTIEYLQRIKRIFNKKTRLYKRFRGL